MWFIILINRSSTVFLEKISERPIATAKKNYVIYGKI